MLLGVHGGFVDGPSAGGGFHEEDHPRDAKGEFRGKGKGKESKKEGGAGSQGGESEPGAGSDHHGYRKASDEEREALRPPVPKMYTNVHVPEDPGHIVIWKAQDEAGRWQPKYTSEHTAGASAAKWERVRQFDTRMAAFWKTVDHESTAAEGAKKETALVGRLVSLTGMRPGSDVETRAAVKAYGATTLQDSHVEVEGDTVKFNFIGKHGQQNLWEVTDSVLSKEIGARKAAGGRLFNTSRAKVLAFVKSAAGGEEFKTKDLRTWMATSIGKGEIERRPVPKTLREFKKARNEIAKIVSKHLNNKPPQALKSYIDPSIFASWHASLGLKENQSK